MLVSGRSDQCSVVLVSDLRDSCLGSDISNESITLLVSDLYNLQVVSCRRKIVAAFWAIEVVHYFSCLTVSGL